MSASPYLDGLYHPVQDELTVTDLNVEGELPRDLYGMFVRNSPNPHFAPPGKYHWFDGDGMVHAIHFENGKATYRNRYIHTAAFEHEAQAGEALWNGILERARMDLPGGPIKNTANTDLVVHNNRLLALWWLSAEPYELSLPDLETRGTFDFQGLLEAGMSAHPKVDLDTGELIFMDFDVFRRPFLRYGVANADGSSVRVVPIDVPTPHIMHDIAITPNYTVLIDCPLGWDPKLLARGKQKLVFNHETPTRFGILPRHGNPEDVKWFESDPCYIYHTIHAQEVDGAIELVACRVDNPMPRGREATPGIPRLHYLDLEPFIGRWRFDLETGESTYTQLDDVATEFPRINDRFLTRSGARFSYNPRVAPRTTLLFDGLIRYDLHSGESTHLTYGEGCFGGEAIFAPREGATDEQDGWILTFVHDERENSARFIVVDARDYEAGPVATIHLPRRVPIGFHADWVPGSAIDANPS